MAGAPFLGNVYITAVPLCADKDGSLKGDMTRSRWSKEKTLGYACVDSRGQEEGLTSHGKRVMSSL